MNFYSLNFWLDFIYTIFMMTFFLNEILSCLNVFDNKRGSNNYFLVFSFAKKNQRNSGIEVRFSVNKLDWFYVG